MGSSSAQENLFSVDPAGYVPEILAGLSWPASERFPVNNGAARVRATLWADLTASDSPLVVAGFSSIASLVDLVAAWDSGPGTGQARVLLGTEPFATNRLSFASQAVAFTDEVRRYWLDQEGVSLRLSAKVVQVIHAMDEGRLDVAYIHGRQRLHAKVYVGADAATIGSSNFTDAGLGSQIEANARFDRTSDPRRYNEVVTVAENLWLAGQPWNTEFRDLLVALLQFVSWQEALARACADLLDGEWAERYLGSEAGPTTLWPSQRQGIAQALWIVENVGSVLIADATGSGKTRMGAHLVRSVRDRLWSTGRVRRDLTVLVCPPAVEDPWYREAVACGLSINTVSHGLLSHQGLQGPRTAELAVKHAQILAVDECHNFLSPSANRTRQVRDSSADHVLLFTATPINRGAVDLLQLVGLLGADNFDDETIAILDHLDRRGAQDTDLSTDQRAVLRREIQRFTVRRTKSMLNELVDRDPEAYRHPTTRRICRYPRHDAQTFDTAETASDELAAADVRRAASQLKGIALLGRRLAIPQAFAREYTPERWRDMRLAAARGLSAHHLFNAMRSSRAALIEHLAGTEEATRSEGIPADFKSQPTGNMIDAIARLASDGIPDIDLACDLPAWLTSPAEWRAACAEELDRYRSILDAARRLSDSRERGKAHLLVELNREHPRVIAFDHSLITLYSVAARMDRTSSKVIIATGANQKRADVERTFSPTSTTAAIALCSDAMNEGLNLQGASAVVHLDLPTTLRVAEQRIGRVDRMDSPHDAIAAWWPKDGPAFATRANELLAARADESSTLLGSNLTVPDFTGRREPIISIEQHIADVENDTIETWDGIHDALEPVRMLVHGSRPLISPAEYARQRKTQHHVLARISPLRTRTPWIFLAIAGTAHGAPHWLILEGRTSKPITRIDAIVDRLRDYLTDDPPSREYDDVCDKWLDHFLIAATRIERQLIPRRHQRALEQMEVQTRHWAAGAIRTRNHELSQRWLRISELTTPTDTGPKANDYQIAETWLTLVQPLLDESRADRKNRRYLRLQHIDKHLLHNPLDVDAVEGAFARLELCPPLAKRVNACIIGVSE